MPVNAKACLLAIREGDFTQAITELGLIIDKSKPVREQLATLLDAIKETTLNEDDLSALFAFHASLCDEKSKQLPFAFLAETFFTLCLRVLGTQQYQGLQSPKLKQDAFLSKALHTYQKKERQFDLQNYIESHPNRDKLIEHQQSICHLNQLREMVDTTKTFFLEAGSHITPNQQCLFEALKTLLSNLALFSIPIDKKGIDEFEETLMALQEAILFETPDEPIDAFEPNAYAPIDSLEEEIEASEPPPVIDTRDIQAQADLLRWQHTLLDSLPKINQHTPFDERVKAIATALSQVLKIKELSPLKQELLACTTATPTMGLTRTLSEIALQLEKASKHPKSAHGLFFFKPTTETPIDDLSLENTTSHKNLRG